MYGLNNSSYTGPGPGAGGFGVYGLSAKGQSDWSASRRQPGPRRSSGQPTASPGPTRAPSTVPSSSAAPSRSSAARRVPPSHTLTVGSAPPHVLESPKNFVEDFGNGQLECGRAAIAMNPDFAALVRLDGPRCFFAVPAPTQRSVCDRSNAQSGFQVEAKDAAADSEKFAGA